jgi:ribosomal protein S18 acetylase RimI-like enzyme
MPPTLLELLHPLHARAPDDGDFDFLAQLYASTRMDLHSATADPAFVAQLVAMQQRFQGAGYRARFPDAAWLVLEQGGAPCGRIVVDTGPSELRLVDIALLPQARGHGLGSHVMRALQAHAAGLGLPLTLSVHHTNPRARQLYLTLGFRAHGTNSAADEMMWNNVPN